MGSWKFCLFLVSKMCSGNAQPISTCDFLGSILHLLYPTPKVFHQTSKNTQKQAANKHKHPCQECWHELFHTTSWDRIDPLSRIIKKKPKTIYSKSIIPDVTCPPGIITQGRGHHSRHVMWRTRVQKPSSNGKCFWKKPVIMTYIVTYWYRFTMIHYSKFNHRVPPSTPKKNDLSILPKSPWQRLFRHINRVENSMGSLCPLARPLVASSKVTS